MFPLNVSDGLVGIWKRPASFSETVPSSNSSSVRLICVRLEKEPATSSQRAKFFSGSIGAGRSGCSSPRSSRSSTPVGSAVHADGGLPAVDVPQVPLSAGLRDVIGVAGFRAGAGLLARFSGPGGIDRTLLPGSWPSSPGRPEAPTPYPCRRRRSRPSSGSVRLAVTGITLAMSGGATSLYLPPTTDFSTVVASRTGTSLPSAILSDASLPTGEESCVAARSSPSMVRVWPDPCPWGEEPGHRCGRVDGR